MHFFYGLGAFVSPMIAAPFILNVDCTPYIDEDDITQPTLSSAVANITTDVPEKSAHKLSRAINLSHSSTAFLTLGAIQVNASNTYERSLLLLRKS